LRCNIVKQKVFKHQWMLMLSGMSCWKHLIASTADMLPLWKKQNNEEKNENSIQKFSKESSALNINYIKRVLSFSSKMLSHVDVDVLVKLNKKKVIFLTKSLLIDDKWCGKLQTKLMKRATKGGGVRYKQDFLANFFKQLSP